MPTGLVNPAGPLRSQQDNNLKEVVPLVVLCVFLLMLCLLTIFIPGVEHGGSGWGTTGEPGP